MSLGPNQSSDFWLKKKSIVHFYFWQNNIGNHSPAVQHSLNNIKLMLVPLRWSRPCRLASGSERTRVRPKCTELVPYCYNASVSQTCCKIFYSKTCLFSSVGKNLFTDHTIILIPNKLKQLFDIISFRLLCPYTKKCGFGKLPTKPKL